MSFIVFEGIDGSGKTTQAEILHRRMTEESALAPVLTRDPGGTEGALEIRNLIVNGDPDRWSGEVDVLLFTAARVANDQQVIKPALAEGRDVVCDRHTYSTAVYQGCRAAPGPERNAIQSLVWDIHEFTNLTDPDLVILLDIDPGKGLARAKVRGDGEDRFESFGIEKQKERRDAYLEFAQRDQDLFTVVDADGCVDEVAGRIRTAHAEWLERNGKRIAA